MYIVLLSAIIVPFISRYLCVFVGQKKTTGS